MRYAKMQDGDAVFAIGGIAVGEFFVLNPTGEMLINAGYLPVEETAPPIVDDDHIAVPHYQETENAIVQSWTVEAKQPTAEDKAEAYDILTGVIS